MGELARRGGAVAEFRGGVRYSGDQGCVYREVEGALFRFGRCAHRRGEYRAGGKRFSKSREVGALRAGCGDRIAAEVASRDTGYGIRDAGCGVRDAGSRRQIRPSANVSVVSGALGAQPRNKDAATEPIRFAQGRPFTATVSRGVRHAKGAGGRGRWHAKAQRR